MPFHLIAALSVLIVVSGSSRLAAEEAPSDWFYRAWQTEDGLPDNSVTGVVQSPDGYLWVGTKGGVMRFNGTEFTPLSLKKLPELPSREVRAMFMDRQGRLWLSTERGPVLRIEENSYRVFSHDEGIPTKVVNSFTDDSKGQLWVAYPNQLCLINGDTLTTMDTSQWFTTPEKANLTCDRSGQVWLANGGRVGRLDEDGFELVHDFGDIEINITASADSGIWLTAGSAIMQIDSENQLESLGRLPSYIDVEVIFEDRNRALWIGTHGAGLLRFRDELLESASTSFHWVDCITEDRDGNIWAGTIGGGLNLINPRLVELVGKSTGLPFTSVRSTAYDTKGRLWAVSQAGHLAYREADQWEFFDKLNDLDKINCVAADGQGRIWIGTRSRGLLMTDGDKLKHYGKKDGLAGPVVRSLLTTTDGDVWIATDQPHRLHRLRDGKISRIRHTGTMKAIRAMTESPDSTIWVGTSDGRLLRVEGDELIDEDAVEDIPSIRTLHSTSDGSLWIGYAGEGLGHLKEGRYKRFTTENGLHDDYISQIQDDGDGSLWIAANRGLFQVGLDELLASPTSSPIKVRCRAFGRSDGLPSFQPSRDYYPDSCRGPNGQLYFSTSSGLVEAHPDIMSADTLPPPVVLERVTVDGEVKALYQSRSMIDPDEFPNQINLSQPEPKLIIPPDHDRLVIHFAALSLAYPENQGFRYRLRPLDKGWEDSDNGHTATFTRLPAGTYKFQVIACNSAGVWNEAGAELDIVVHPFFWETWWFRTGGGLLTAFAAGGLVFLRLRRKHQQQLRGLAATRALEQERSRIARDIHDDLGASLTRISLLSQSSPNPEDKPTNEVLDKIQTTARHLMRSMDGVVWAIDPEHDTFDDLANYLSSYAQEFLNVAGIRCRLGMPLVLPELPLTAQLRHNLFLAFKEALNNVVKYAEATEVRISLLPSDDSFVLRIQDNGQGIDPDAPADPSRSHGGSGLANMESRMEEIGGSCLLQSTLGEGTTVEFRVPFKINP